MSSIRETDIVERLIDQWRDPASSDLREEAAKEINDLRRACRAMARDIMRLKDPAQASYPSLPGESAAA
jgi:hypothetical protein